jgi:hypothetical protein
LLDLTVLVLVTSTIAAVKVPYLIIWLPIVGLFVEKYGSRTAGRWELLAVAVANLTVAALWYTHADRLGAQTGLSFGLTDKLFDADLVFSLRFPAQIFERLFRDVFGPIALAATAVGFVIAVTSRRWFEVGGIAAFVIYLVVVAVGNYEHDYYQLAIMPVAPSLAAVGMDWMVDRLTASSQTRRDLTLAVFLALAAGSTFIRLVSGNSWLEYSAADVEFCRAIQEVSRPEERIVFVNEGNPQIMVCADRKGWLLDNASMGMVEEAIAAGGHVAVLPREFGDESIRTLLASQGRVVTSSAKYDVFRIRD